MPLISCQNSSQGYTCAPLLHTPPEVKTWLESKACGNKPIPYAITRWSNELDKQQEIIKECWENYPARYAPNLMTGVVTVPREIQ